MRRNSVISLLVATMILVVVASCSAGETEEPHPTVPANVSIPEQFNAGESLYAEYCEECHGIRGSGSDEGPPVVHIIYEPSHHGDPAFQAAITDGAQEHHWTFGNMDAIPGLTLADMQAITAYVRFLQREIGIN